MCEVNCDAQGFVAGSVDSSMERSADRLETCEYPIDVYRGYLDLAVVDTAGFLFDRFLEDDDYALNAMPRILPSPKLSLKQRRWGFVLLAFDSFPGVWDYDRVRSGASTDGRASPEPAAGAALPSERHAEIYINGVLWYLMRFDKPVETRFRNAFLETAVDYSSTAIPRDDFFRPFDEEVVKVPDAPPETHLIAADLSRR